MKLLTRVAAVAALIVLALAGTAGPAAAHNTLISSDPADGAELDTAPREVTLTFDQEVQEGDVNEVVVTGPDGDRWTDGTATVDGNVVTAPLRELGPAGEYVLGYRVLSADGHPVSEELRFTQTQPGQGTPAASGPQAEAGEQNGNQAETGEDSPGVPVWVWLVAAAVLVVAGVAVALRTGRDDG